MHSTPDSVLHALFDPEQGWLYSAEEVSVHPLQGPEYKPFYLLIVDASQVLVTIGDIGTSAGTDLQMPALAVTIVTGLNGLDAEALARVNAYGHGLPCWGMNDDREVVLSNSLPFAAEFPVDLLRKQMLVV